MASSPLRLQLMITVAMALHTTMAAAAVQPHLLFVLVDDLGFNGVGYQNPSLKTPTIDALASAGAKLSGFYTYKVCAPARASFLTGRYPFKLSATRGNFAYFMNEEGTDLGYTMFPAKLKQAGYATHMIGKWHQGFYCPQYLPTSRGFDTYFGFLSGCEDHVSQHTCGSTCHNNTNLTGPAVDLYGSTKPAWGFNGTNNGFTFTSHAVDLVTSHAAAAAAKPFFLYMALHNTHAPFEVPAQYSALYNFSSPLQQTWSGMVSMVDETVSNLTTALKAAGMWDTTLMVMAGDNGSPTTGWGAAGSNAPLRGSKASNWEGGVHTFGFVTGGFLPASQRGQTLAGMVHISDFYKTFVTLAGGDPVDKGGQSPQDSIDQSGYLLGTVAAPPRTEMVHDHFLSGKAPNLVATGAIRVGDWKLLVGPAGAATWFGQFSPNATYNGTAAGVVGCKDAPCLFNIKEDPTEHNDLAARNPDQVAKLMTAFNKLDSEFHPSGSKGYDYAGYCNAAAANKGFMSPWLPGPVNASRTRRLEPGENGEDPILAMLRDAADEETARASVEAYARGGGVWRE